MKYLISAIVIFILSSPVKADDTQLYLNISGDWIIPMEAGQDLGANIEGGIRFFVTEETNIYAGIGHHSFWFNGAPFNDEDEAGYDYLRFGVEFTW